MKAEQRSQEFAGNAFRVAEIGFQFGAIEQRTAEINTRAGAFRDVLARMNDRGILRYIASAIMRGELTTPHVCVAAKADAKAFPGCCRTRSER